MKTRIAAAAGLLGAAYALFRPRMLRWGATDDEVRAPFPAPELIPGGTKRSTMAATLDAPPGAVWPWLVQMGYDKGGFYSWDRLDNLGKPSAEAIHPEWQRLAVGDRVMGGDIPCFEVAALEPPRFLALRSLMLPGPMALLSGNPSVWAFELRPAEGGRTRVVVTVFQKPRWIDALAGALFWEAAHWIMQRRQFENLERRVTRAAAERAPLSGSIPTAVPAS